MQRVHLDHADLDDHQGELSKRAPRVLLERLVAISGCDVYRSYGVLIGKDPGPPAPVRATEEGPRARSSTRRGATPHGRKTTPSVGRTTTTRS